MDLEAFFHEYKEKKNAYQMALSTMYYDQATIAPKNGIPYRNRMTADVYKRQPCGCPALCIRSSV